MENEKIGLFDAKTRFSEIVERVVRHGRPITVTRRGKPAVDITPTQSRVRPRMDRSEAFAELERLRAEIPRMTQEEILDLIAESRPGHD